MLTFFQVLGSHHAMRIPQELVDEIISEFDLSEKYDFVIHLTLKSCALAARSFVQPCQERLFSRISMHDYDKCLIAQEIEPLAAPPDVASVSLSRQLATLLSSSPHIATYIRTLDLCYSATTEASFIPLILCAVTALETLILMDDSGERFPVNPSTIAVFSLPSLKRVELSNYYFDNPFELESLLRKGKSLKELTLRAISFASDEHGSGVTTDVRPSDVALEILILVRLDSETIQSMLNIFTAVDIRHVKWLSIFDSPLKHLLRANAPSVQKLKTGKTVLPHPRGSYHL